VGVVVGEEEDRERRERRTRGRSAAYDSGALRARPQTERPRSGVCRGHWPRGAIGPQKAGTEPETDGIYTLVAAGSEIALNEDLNEDLAICVFG